MTPNQAQTQSTTTTEADNVPGSSLAAFWNEVFRPLLESLQPRRILEIGADTGSMTRKLLQYSAETGAKIDSIDPKPSFDVEKMVAQSDGRLAFYRQLSLDVLKTVDPPDLALIDGDHNWYTVLHELNALELRAQTANVAPPVIALHDIDWPYGRRDLYYDPATLPDEAVRPYEYKGVVPATDELSSQGLNRRLANARLPDEHHSGIRGAIEDFIEQSALEWDFHEIHGQHGIGILIPVESRLSDPVRGYVEWLQSAEFLRKRIETIENARIDSELRLARIEIEAEEWVRRTEAEATAVRTDLQRQLAETSRRLVEANTEMAKMYAETEHLRGRVLALQSLVEEYETSTSWRITAWLRALTKLVRR